jgi:hypothetical protein
VVTLSICFSGLDVSLVVCDFLSLMRYFDIKNVMVIFKNRIICKGGLRHPLKILSHYNTLFKADIAVFLVGGSIAVNKRSLMSRLSGFKMEGMHIK